MQRSSLRGAAGSISAIVVIGLAACAESLAPVESLAPTEPASSDATIHFSGGEICTPCPPGVVCAAVCQTFDPVPVPEVPGDTTSDGTDAAVIFGPAATSRTRTAGGGVEQR